MPIKFRIVGMGAHTASANVIVGTVDSGKTAAGTNQATAAQLSTEDNHVFTIVAAGTGAVFQAGKYAPGDHVRIANYGANALSVYPASGGNLSQQGVNAAVSLSPNYQGIFTSIDGTDWFVLIAPAASIPTTQTLSINCIIDGGAAPIITGLKAWLVVDFACTINSATLLADQSGSIVVNVWKTTYAGYPGSVANKITASAPPTITTAVKSQDTTLTGWTTAIAAGDILYFNVDSATSIQKCTIDLKVTR